ncbi:MAG TPA: trypsin-like peptidase domain-containing protein [Thermoleophilaceae bacterium]|nr:trypsin-like peptidase domain-containing protein [Thermoleophilaceae bacterium]
MVKSARAQTVLAGAFGGLVVLVLGAILIATGIIDTGDESSEPIISQSPIIQPAVDEDGDGSTVNEIYRRAQRGVAFIEARGGTNTSPFGLPDRGGGSGSGFVISDEGFVVTNAHLVEGSKAVRVRFGEPGEDESVDARVVGVDPSTDIAVLKVDIDADKLEPLPLGDSSKLKVGDPAIAIGNPFGFDQTVTTGIVSALQRQIPAPNNFSIDDVIQTDASVNPGNSGGPLLDAAGRVIGVNSQIATGGTQGSVGIGFAVPVNTVKEVVPQLEEDGKIERPYIGVTTAPVADLARDLNLPADRGALVQDVQPRSPAARAGLRAGRTRTEEGITLGGDLILRVDGRDVASPEDVAEAIEDNKPGDSIEIEFLRGRGRESVDLELAPRPAKAGAVDPREGLRPPEDDDVFPLP